jgi:hypothetical protein
MFSIIAVIAAIIIKVVTTTYILFLHPVQSISAIPGNWRRVVLSTDSATYPELLPGLHHYLDINPLSSLDNISVLRLVGIFRPSFGDDKGFVKTLIVGAILLLFVIIYTPAIAYRWSVKSTAVIWSPLLWIFKPFKGPESLMHFARGVVTLAVYKITRAYSILILCLFTTKVTTWIFWHYWENTLRKIPGWFIVDSYLMADRIALWHITAAVSSFLSLWIWVQATEYIHDFESGKDVPTAWFERVFRASFVSRNFLGVYTALCTVYITISIASKLDLPPLHILVFPWNNPMR